MMGKLRILFPEKSIEKEDIILELARELRRELGGELVGVESFSGSDGSNIRIIVRYKTWEVIDKIIKAIWRFEKKKGIEGTILPEINDLKELLLVREGATMHISDEIILMLRNKLKEKLGDNLIDVESFSGPDGSNIRITVRKKTWETIDKILEVIWQLERERGIEGSILPEIEVQEFA